MAPDAPGRPVAGGPGALGLPSPVWAMPMRTLLAPVAPLLVALAFVPQGPPAPQPDRPTFSTRSELVVLHVTVKDRRGEYVSGLAQDAFRVLDDEREQSIRFFSSEDAPASIGLLIDSSGSMQPNESRVIAAASAFANTSNPQDEFFALAFNERVHAALPPGAPFTENAGTLRKALVATLAARGQTALYDAIDEGLRYVRRASFLRKVLVIVSDGADNASLTEADVVLRRTQASNVIIYTVGLFDEVSGEGNPKILKRLALETGGEAFAPRSNAHVLDVLAHIAREIRHTYTLGYAPTEMGAGPTFHHIRVVVKSARHRRLMVRTRTGYLASERPYEE